MTVTTPRPDEVVKEWCDAGGGHYTDPGTTRPMAPRSIYRICSACLDRSAAAYRDAGFDQMPPLMQRVADGDR
jgi:hypothetical protein